VRKAVKGSSPDLHAAPRPVTVPKDGATLRVIAADQHLFEQLAGGEFRVSSRSDRMGYRLEGSVVRSADGERISASVATGTVQVTPSGQPILLMADHATTGGYPMAGTVVAADISVAAQLAPGDWVRFVSCSLAEADAALRDQEGPFGGG
jgi:antagonist of KipI